MKIYDENWKELTGPDLSLGHTEPGRRLIARHEAVEARPALYDWEVLEGTQGLYPGGLRRLVETRPARPATSAWDEYEDCLIYRPYTAEELAEREKPGMEERLAALEGALLELMLLGAAPAPAEDPEAAGDAAEEARENV